MRGLLARADLSRYAGQFVWLELNYDEAKNQAFFTKYNASATPSFFIIDPHDEKVVAAQTGAMSELEITQFLDRGASGVFAKRQTPADAALKRGDAVLALQPAEAAKAYQEALRLAPPEWPGRELAEASLAGALQDSRQWQRCAETAAAEAALMKRDEFFVRTVVAAMWCLASADPSAWSNAELERLEPLAQEALSLSVTVRDHRDSIYRTLMYVSVARNDTMAAGEWGNRWLVELDAIKPIDNEERSALDIARVENIQIYGDPNRVLAALVESERMMPENYIASLRLAQMESLAKHYENAIGACNRGLARKPGPNGRAWLLEIKAQALNKKGRTLEARKVLEQAIEAAQEIPNKMSRDRSLKKIRMALENQPVAQ